MMIYILTAVFSQLLAENINLITSEKIHKVG